MNIMTTRRVALYARVSTNKGKADPNKQHTDNQLIQLRAYCERQGWTVVKEYIDEDSGRKAKRADFLQLFEDLPTAGFDLVLFWALDRFSREGVRPTLNYLQRLDNAGIGYKSMTEEYFDSAGMFKDAIISIVATLANQEAVRHVERVNAGLDRARAKGTRLGRKALPEAKLELVKKLRAEGLSIRAIASEANVSVGKVSEIIKAI